MGLQDGLQPHILRHLLTQSVRSPSPRAFREKRFRSSIVCLLPWWNRLEPFDETKLQTALEHVLQMWSKSYFWGIWGKKDSSKRGKRGLWRCRRKQPDVTANILQCLRPLAMKVQRPFRTSANSNRETRRQIPEDLNFQLQSCLSFYQITTSKMGSDVHDSRTGHNHEHRNYGVSTQQRSLSLRWVTNCQSFTQFECSLPRYPQPDNPIPTLAIIFHLRNFLISFIIMTNIGK